MNDATSPDGRDPDVHAEVNGQRADRPAPGLGGPAEGFAQLFESLLSDGQQGRLMTESIIAAGLADDPRRLRRIYRNNQQELDAYFGEIDTSALARMSGAEEGAETAGSSAALGFAGGAALSLVLQQISD